MFRQDDGKLIYLKYLGVNTLFKPFTLLQINLVSRCYNLQILLMLDFVALTEIWIAYNVDAKKKIGGFD